MSVTDIRIDPDRLVDWASQAIGVPSFTGSEEAMAELMRDTFVDLGLQVQWQQVEDGRASPGSRRSPASSRAPSSRADASTASGSRT